MTASGIDPASLDAAGTLLLAVAPEPETATSSIWTPDLEAMGPRAGITEARDAAVQVLFLLRDRAEHQGRLDLALRAAIDDLRGGSDGGTRGESTGASGR